MNVKVFFSLVGRAGACGALALSFLSLSGQASAQANQFAGDPQHTSNYGPAQRLNQINWTTSNNISLSGAFAHYAAPLVTAANTVIVPVRIAADGLQLDMFDGATGAFRYTISSDWIHPSAGWRIPAQPAVVPGAPARLYYPGAGGTIMYVDDPDALAPPTPTRLIWYTDLATYTANAAAYNSTMFVNTPITADSAGNIYFGFRVDGTAPAPFGTQGGFVRIDPSGNATYVLAGTAAGDANISRSSHGSAPVLSNDETTVYVYAKWSTNSNYGYLLGLDATTLATKYQVFLKDPRNGLNGGLTDFSTASPMIGPDNEVYAPIMANPYNGSRGWLLHFNEDLTVEKTPGAFGWDYTPALIPSSMIPSYTGTSTYLLFAKYNNYGITDGNAINAVAILDPSANQTEYHSTAPVGMQIMREILHCNSPTPDSGYPSFPGAVREFCINAAAVDASTNSVLFDCEDGHLYRWNLEKNQLDQAVQLNSGLGQPYVPTVIGPDGTVYTLNGGYMFSIGNTPGVDVTLESDVPDMREVVFGDTLTFTANISGISGTPTGTVTFTDLAYTTFTPVNTVLGVVPVDAGGNAALVISTLTAGGADLGNHRITATYSGDGVYPSGYAALQQKVHPYSTVTNVTTTSPSAYGVLTTIYAHVASGGGTPSGYVTFMDGTTFLAQLPINVSGDAAFSTDTLGVGAHTINAFYNSDTWFAMSSGSASHTIEAATSTALVSSGSPTTYTTSVAFTATVTPTVLGAGTPSGTVTFKDGVTTIGSVAVNGSGDAVLNISTLGVGGHSITAEFVGDSGWGLSTSSSLAHSVTETTTTAIVSSPTGSISGQLVTFTATISPTHAAAGTPTGSVEFTEGATILATVAVNGAGQAAFNINTLSVGGHTIVATFTGTGGWQGSNGNVVHVVSLTDTTPPPQPTGLVIVAGPTSGRVTLTWSATVDAGGISHYEIWRSNKATTGFALVTTTSATTYIDNIGRRKKRYYYIIAVDNAGNRSVKSATVLGNSGP